MIFKIKFSIDLKFIQVYGTKYEFTYFFEV